MDHNTRGIDSSRDQQLLNEFRLRYHQYVRNVEDITVTSSDPTVIARLGDDIMQFSQLVEQVHGGGRGRPRLVIDPTWLRWAYGHKSIADIARFLNIHRSTVRAALIEYGISECRSDPFAGREGEPSYDDGRSSMEEVENNPGDGTHDGYASESSDEHNQDSETSDDDLDTAVRELRVHYRRAGATMMVGFLRGTLGIHVSKARVRQSLLRIDPVRRVFDRIRIERRKYQVAGPNALWHHDGQHGMSIHNVRIERLWVDVTAQVTSKWADFFTDLELRHGLNINNIDHIHLLHYLFLPLINTELLYFVSGWNHHTISGVNRTPSDMFGWDMYVHGIRGGQLPPHQQLLTDEELEYYGVDFEGLGEDALLGSREANNPEDEGVSSFLGRIPPAERLNTIAVETGDTNWPEELIQGLQGLKYAVQGRADDESLTGLWTASLVLMCTYFGDVMTN
ncbi:uncharacterized protein B0H18DRAFT_869901 [Fomitopsis serialis]|uniref:uncharacterized protein n=1 Tax=Fomitopsis serialis TaxID=139415 RepID=UPI002008D6DD|nr:uncharacterized protein B0H18DRAFT_1171568 [Neoantrodia serialis]XP_047898303.1 uncharacterized protein B0H18DRAFT_869901 [Neoantrodia serialis]KAH9925166.1 hypothetical protein B0H18DRAFT_1171568 [Neoantrodia serialis]KAH9934237.1 hypothetical protein B0H18DRAFT_869901 [Neoantrodia serialis]